MYVLKAINKKLSQYLDVGFSLKFIVLVAALYYFNVLYIKISQPGEQFYNSFIAGNLDYVGWIRLSILHTANLIVHVFGFPSYLADVYTLRIAEGVGVIMGWPCIGLGIMSFWIAFIAAQDIKWKQKLFWAATGVAIIWIMNCWRIALLLIALNQRWKVNSYNQHKMFNLGCYCLIIGMMYLYHQKSKRKPQPVKALSGT